MLVPAQKFNLILTLTKFHHSLLYCITTTSFISLYNFLTMCFFLLLQCVVFLFSFLPLMCRIIIALHSFRLSCSIPCRSSCFIISPFSPLTSFVSFSFPILYFSGFCLSPFFSLIVFLCYCYHHPLYFIF